MRCPIWLEYHRTIFFFSGMITKAHKGEVGLGLPEKKKKKKKRKRRKMQRTKKNSKAGRGKQGRRRRERGCKAPVFGAKTIMRIYPFLLT